MDVFFWQYNTVDTLATIGFVVIGLFFIVMLVRGAAGWHRNNRSPRLTVNARVVAKRIDVNHYRTANAGDMTGAHGYHTSSSTWYYVTFQVESGDRMELSVDGTEYGMLAEGDAGRLSFQGTRYLGFERGTKTE